MAKKTEATAAEAFLAAIRCWRELLAENLCLRNESISDCELNAAVRGIVERVVLLRMCEGRGIGPCGRLQSLLQGDGVYRRLLEMFPRAGDMCDSGWFHFQRDGDREPHDELIAGLTIDDGVLKGIVRGLCDAEGPNGFAALPADILGQVHERFLGQSIGRRAGRSAQIEKRPGVRKASGVYYTPTYIVDYIVEHTIGRLVEGKTPQEVGGLTATYKEPPPRPSPQGEGSKQGRRPLSVLDPACGGGAFLIVAYQYLLEWYLERYVESDARRHAGGAAPRICRTTAGDWQLTFAERKRILLAHIFGVDIDSRAVEVAKLSLLFKLLEGETEHAAGLFDGLQQERALPDLSNNIKCGNSLVGTDFISDRRSGACKDDELQSINAFDWDAGFKSVMDTGGFDVVIGNPPYLNGVEETTRFAESYAKYFRDKFQSARGAIDASILFQEQAIALLKEQGMTSFIVPNKFLSAPFGAAFRAFAAGHCTLERLADFSQARVFPGVGVYPVVYVLRRASAPGVSQAIVERFAQGPAAPVLASTFARSADLRHLGTWDEIASSGGQMLDRIRRSFQRLGDHYEVAAAASAGEAYDIKPCIVDGPSGEPEFFFLTSGSIDRYAHSHGIKKTRYLKTDYRDPRLPRNCEALSANRRRQYSSEKIVIAGMTKRLEAILDDGRSAASVPCVQILASGESPYPLKFILGILNSRFVDWVFKQCFGSLSLAGGYLRIGVPQISALPVIAAERGVRIDSLITQVVDVVDVMIQLNVSLRNVRIAGEEQDLMRRIDAVDSDLDRLVYQWFELSSDEIAEVESRGE